MEPLIKDRSKREYMCPQGPKLILIADKPLPTDREEIFDSTRGLNYLAECFKSKFKAAETHVTYISDEKNITSIVKNGFEKIMNYYGAKGTIDINKLVIGFIGQEAYNHFKDEADNSYFSGYDITVRESLKTLKFYFSTLNSGRDFQVPYVILPDIDEDYSSVSEILDNTNIAKNITRSPYCTTKEIIGHLSMLLNMYKEKQIKGIRFDSKIVKSDDGKLYTEYFKFYDYNTCHEMIYNSRDNICKDDTQEDIKAFQEKFKEVIRTIPICGPNLDQILPFYRFKDITVLKEEEVAPAPYEFVLDRPYFKLTGERKGPESIWYKKWYEKVLNGALVSKKRDLIKRDNYTEHKYEWIYDIEVFKNDWLFVAKTVDGKGKCVCWNDPINLAKWIGDKILIGFNNAGYDDSVIRHAMALPYAVEGSLSVKEFSDALIYDLPDVKKFPQLQERYKNDKNTRIPPFLSWDVSFHMPFDIRRNSLKKLTMSVLNKRNYDSAISFDTPRPLTQEEREEVVRYCELDVDNTRELFLPAPGDEEKKAENPKYKMREFARDSYDIKWNLIVTYNMTAKTLITKSSSFAGKVLCGEDAKPNTKNTYKNIDGKNVYYSIPELAYKELSGTSILDFYIKHQQDPDYIKEKFEYYMGGDDEGHKYQFGFGGLHQALINFGAKNLCNFDVASLYPSLMIQYKLGSRGMANPEAYEEVYKTRIDAKHRGDTLLNLGLKLILNGSIGATLSDYNPLFDTWTNSTICVHGQLLLFILCKRLYEAGFNIVQTNTDGIMVERRDDIDFMPICKAWEEETRLVLEYDDIDVVQQANVNNYYCRFSNGKVKSKGFYLSNEKYGLAVSKILCNMVEEKPYLEGIKPRDFVIYKRHGIGEIYDAVTNQKLDGRSLAFVIGKVDDPRTQAYYSRSRNERMIAVKDEKGKTLLDENGNEVLEATHTISKVSGFTEHMLLIDDVNDIKMEDINTAMYVAAAKNLLGEVDTFGPYYDEHFNKTDDVSFLQALNPLKDNSDEHPTKSGVICQNFLFECDYLTREEQEELIKPIEKYTYRIVWSGSRSYHIVVRIDKPCTSITYKKIWYYLQNKLGLEGADEQPLPNKYTRVEGQINPKTGNMQELYSENKYVFNLDEIVEDMPKLKDLGKKPAEYKGEVSIKALERHIKRQNWTEGNRFAACQKLSPVLISQVSLEELIKMIPISLDKDHIYVLKSKIYYNLKYKSLNKRDESFLDKSEEI